MSGNWQHCRGKHTSRMKKIVRKRVFAEFVKSKQLQVSDSNSDCDVPTLSWMCCDETFTDATEIHKHVAKYHSEAVDQALTSELQKANPLQLKTHCHGDCTTSSVPARLYNGENNSDGLLKSCKCLSSSEDESHRCTQRTDLPRQPDSSQGDSNEDRTLLWLPSLEECQNLDRAGVGQILLFYKYVDIEDPTEIAQWQRRLCQRLHLTGKIRLASEGINGTVGGCIEATELYIRTVLAHPTFEGMTSLDFKKSSGSSSHFPQGLKVGVYQEIVPMGVDPKKLSYREAGLHLTPSEFHEKMDQHVGSEEEPSSRQTVVVDCRNFYESKIGTFKGAVTPNIRKFSYWPEYVDKNLDFFQDKTVVMYCTGGIRCERGSAYLKSKGVCKEIYQLEGGIHKYMEEFPDGHFQGKLFVFDDRYAIHTNDKVVASCFHCSQPWDQYQPCSSPHCHQLVLACPSCRAQGSTACCTPCGNSSTLSLNEGRKVREECLCTRTRVRIPAQKSTMSSP